jgi:hypothetical protein
MRRPQLRTQSKLRTAEVLFIPGTSRSRIPLTTFILAVSWNGELYRREVLHSEEGFGEGNF